MEYTGTIKGKRPNMWKGKAEALVALLAMELSLVRDVNAIEACTELNYRWLRKRAFTNGKTPDLAHYGPTFSQLAILNNKGC